MLLWKMIWAELKNKDIETLEESEKLEMSLIKTLVKPTGLIPN